MYNFLYLWRTFSQSLLISKALDGIHNICKYSIDKDVLIAIGSPLLYKNSLYNCAVVIFGGKILGIVPKSYLPNYSEFYEKRWFTEGYKIKSERINLPFQENIPFGVNLIFLIKFSNLLSKYVKIFGLQFHLVVILH